MFVLMRNGLFVFVLYIFLIIVRISASDDQYCELKGNKPECSDHSTSTNKNRYILYDVNPPEGFNLRRDVYMRLAVFVHNLQRTKNAKPHNFTLVLPPWTDLYHWRRNAKVNVDIPWSHFFDLKSLQKFAPVIEMHQFFDEMSPKYAKLQIDEVYILQNFDEMFESGNFEDKMEQKPCTGDDTVNFYHYENVTSQNIRCLSFHGHASQLASILLSNSRTFLFHHAEIVLHDYYGDRVYWQARRSMRFNNQLNLLAGKFREKYLNSSDELDETILPDDWQKETPRRTAKGGPYLCVHLRRRDFLWGRSSEVPDLQNAAQQIRNILEDQRLRTVFVSTDAPEHEYDELENTLQPKYKVIKFTPTAEILRRYKYGGVAIIDQIICSHAYYFVGTHESTFSFRIQEEREILGFPTERTFNRLCGSGKKGKKCEKPSVWKIVY